MLAAKQKVDKPSTILRDARLAIKNRNGQDAILNRIKAAIAREDVSNDSRAELLYCSALLYESLNELENRKAYLKQKYDTAKFYNTLLTMYEQLRLCDSVDWVPNAKGKVNLRFARRCSALRVKHRANILNGGKFYLRKRDLKHAFPYLDRYYTYRTSDDIPDFNKVVIWCTQCCYEAKDYPGVFRFVDKAIEVADQKFKAILMEYKVLSFKAIGDDEAWLEALQSGQQQYPNHMYFFAQLADYYLSHRSFEDGISMCKRQIALYPDSAIYWYAESNFELKREHFHDAICCADSAIALQPNHTEAHFNRAMAYISLATIAKEDMCTDLNNPVCVEQRRMIQDLYRRAQTSMEVVRKNEPDKPTRWGTPLYKIYLNLNMGKEFDEIDNILKK